MKGKRIKAFILAAFAALILVEGSADIVCVTKAVAVSQSNAKSGPGHFGGGSFGGGGAGGTF